MVWDFFEKNSLFPYNEVKNKKFVLHSVNVFKALLPGSYIVLQITKKLSCIKHFDLLLASSVLNVNYKIRNIHIRIFVRTNCCITCTIGS